MNIAGWTKSEATFWAWISEDASEEGEACNPVALAELGDFIF